MVKTLTVAEVGERLQVSRQTAYKIVNLPGFPRINLGRSIRVTEQALEQWLNEQTNNGADLLCGDIDGKRLS